MMRLRQYLQQARPSKAAGLALLVAALLSGCEKPAPVPAKPGGTNALALSKTNALSAASSTNALAETNSIFDDKRKNARDPFFPNSQRRGELAVKPKPTNPVPGEASQAPRPVVEPVIPIEKHLVLSGIFKQAGQRIAVLNGRTLALDEEVVVQLPNGKKTRVRCLEIGAQSVTVTLDGKPERKKIILKH